MTSQYPSYPQPDYSSQFPEPPKKKSRKLPIIVALLVAAGLLLGLGVAIGQSTPKPVAAAPTSAVSAPAVQQAVPTTSTPTDSYPTPGQPVPDAGVPIGMTVEYGGGVRLTAGPLKVKQGIGDSLLCSRVDYENGSTQAISYNGLFDWKLQTPDNVIVNSTVFVNRDVRVLNSGDLPAGQKVSGDVCFEEPDQKGSYVVINDPLTFQRSNVIRWNAPRT